MNSDAAASGEFLGIDGPNNGGNHGPSRERAAIATAVRLIPWAFLLIVEVIGLTMHFDTSSPTATWLTRAVALIQGMLRVASAAGSILVLIYGAWVFEWLGQLDCDHLTGRRLARQLLIHAAAFCLFTWLTSQILNGAVRPWPAAFILSTAWAAVGLATVITWVAIGIPYAKWMPLARRGPGLLLVGIAAGLATWGLSQLATELWHPLGRSTLWLVHTLLRCSYGETIYRPDVFDIGTPRFHVEIYASCSGFEGMGLMFALTASYLWMSRRSLRFPHALGLIPVAVFAIWLANAVRIALLIALGTAGYPSIAIGGFHSQTGWLAFNALALGLIACAHHWLSPDNESSNGEEDARVSSSIYLLPLLALMITSMLTAAFSDGFDRLYFIRIMVGGAVLYVYRARYRGLWRGPDLASLAIGAIAFAIWMALEPLAPAAQGDARFDAEIWLGGLPRATAIAWLFCRAMGSILFVPMVEELAFRGYLSRRLITSDYETIPIGTYTWTSFLASSILFGMLHGRWLAGFLVGMLYAYALYRRRNLGDAVAAHATTNALIAAYVLVTGDLGQWV